MKKKEIIVLDKNGWSLSTSLKDKAIVLEGENFTHSLTIPENDIKNMIAMRFVDPNKKEVAGVKKENQEIEYKYLLEPTHLWKNEVKDVGNNFKQLYLAKDDSFWQARLRIINDESALITIKGPKIGLSGAEFEYDFPVDIALQLWETHPGVKLEKCRYIVSNNGNDWEIDEFVSPALKGLHLAELEVKSVDQVFDKPTWLSVDVTTNKNYKNDRIAEYNKNMEMLLTENPEYKSLVNAVHKNGVVLTLNKGQELSDLSKLNKIVSNMSENLTEQEYVSLIKVLDVKSFINDISFKIASGIKEDVESMKLKSNRKFK